MLSSLAVGVTQPASLKTPLKSLRILTLGSHHVLDLHSLWIYCFSVHLELRGLIPPDRHFQRVPRPRVSPCLLCSRAVPPRTGASQTRAVSVQHKDSIFPWLFSKVPYVWHFEAVPLLLFFKRLMSFKMFHLTVQPMTLTGEQGPNISLKEKMCLQLLYSLLWFLVLRDCGESLQVFVP